MRRRRAILVLLAVLALACSGGPARAYDKVRFRSLDAAQTPIDGYLFRPAGEGRHPALVFLHGCGGILNRRGEMLARESDWAARLNTLGYVVLMTDSFTPRGHGEMCSTVSFSLKLYRDRPKDAYGALLYLQAQPFVKPDRVGVIGWSQGGGTLLMAIGDESLGRPAALPAGDFRAAVAFYPASCRDGTPEAPVPWTRPWKTAVPLLILSGAKDVWTPEAPCRAFAEAAASRGSPLEFMSYPGAYHDFDWPDEPLRELTRYRTRDGVVPIAGTDPAAREDALQRVPAFLQKYLMD